MNEILNNIRGALRIIVNGREETIPLLFTHGITREHYGFRIHLAYYKEEGSHNLVQIHLILKQNETNLTGRLMLHGYGDTDRDYPVEDPILQTILGYVETICERVESLNDDTEVSDLVAIARIMKTDIDLTNDEINPHTFL